VPVVSENALQRTREALVVAGRDEPAVLPVDQAVAPRDRIRPAHDDRLPERHRLQEDGRRTGVAVLQNGERYDACLRQSTPHLLEREIDLELDVFGPRA